MSSFFCNFTPILFTGRMDLSVYFKPIIKEQIDFEHNDYLLCLGDSVVQYVEEGNFPDVPASSLVMIGVGEDRNSFNNKGSAESADAIRKKLYRLAIPHNDLKLYDLGNLIVGNTPQDTYFALTEVMAKLIGQQSVVILLGGSQDLIYPVYCAYEMLGKVMNLCSVDSRFDLDDGENIHSRNYLKHIILRQPNFLFNYSHLAYQSYFVGERYIQLMEELNFDAYPLGWVQANMDKVEPLVRNADVVSIDMGAVRQSDAPANADPSPHGLYGEELCQMVHLSGLSEATSFIGFFEMNAVYDNRYQTAHLIAHAIWYFISGYCSRRGESPLRDKRDFRRFVVQMPDEDLEIVFFKSKFTERWWMEIPSMGSTVDNAAQSSLIPCSFSDYEKAMANEIPELWLKTCRRINEFGIG